MSEVLETFTLQVIGPEREDTSRVRANLPALVEAAEEDLSDVLPEGYEVVIRKWDEEER